MHILEVLFPVFSLVLVGYIYARIYQPNLRAVNQIMLYVLVPALVFDVMSRESFELAEYSWLALCGLVVVLGSGLVAWPIARLYGYNWRAFVPAMMFNNCGNLGLPLALLAFGDAGLEAMVILFLVSNMFHFTLGTWMFGGIVSWKGLMLNPVYLATMAGLVVNFTDTTISPVLLRPVEMLGQIVIPFMLFSLGVRMITVKRSHLKSGLVGALVCPLSGLLPALLIGLLFPLDGVHFAVLVLFAALPPAVLNFLFAEQYHQDPELMASLVLVGNAMSVCVIGVVLWWII